MSAAQHLIIVYTQPECSWCLKVKDLIHSKGLPYMEVDISKGSPEFRESFKAQFAPKDRTVPKVFIDGTTIGGYEQVVAFFDDPSNEIAFAPLVYPPLQVKRLSPTARLPERGSEEAIGVDVFANLGIGETILIPPNEVRAVPTGIAVKPPPGHYIRVAPRSGLASKRGIDTLAGVVDRDYTGEVKVILTTHDYKPYEIKHGDKIAQLIMERATISPVVEVKSLASTARGDSGFGSTGR